ncbi:hypothetical protein ACEPAH_5179 [Sanghuangporus vaninii]
MDRNESQRLATGRARDGNFGRCGASGRHATASNSSERTNYSRGRIDRQPPSMHEEAPRTQRIPHNDTQVNRDESPRPTSQTQDGYLSWRNRDDPGMLRSASRDRPQSNSPLPQVEKEPDSTPAQAPEPVLKMQQISHDDIKPGMCVYIERDTSLVTGQWSKRPMSRSKHHEHLEIVLSKSASDDPRPHVLTVMITSFGSSKSFKSRAIRSDKYKYCVPFGRAVKEKDDQPDHVSFGEGKGLAGEQTKPSWITIHRRPPVYADSNYKGVPTEMDEATLEGLETRVKQHEAETAAAVGEAKKGDSKKGKTKKGTSKQANQDFDNIMTIPSWR